MVGIIRRATSVGHVTHYNLSESAGICSYKSTGQCTISLSEPLLRFRTREDLIDTLLVRYHNAVIHK